jgi:ATP-dependent DNA ligase
MTLRKTVKGRWCSARHRRLQRVALARRHDDEVQLYAFDILSLDGDDLRGLPLSMRKTNLAR